MALSMVEHELLQLVDSLTPLLNPTSGRLAHHISRSADRHPVKLERFSPSPSGGGLL